jgi:hypothetical protein
MLRKGFAKIDIAFTLSDLQVLCDYTIDFAFQRTYLLNQAEATPESKRPIPEPESGGE